MPQTNVLPGASCAAPYRCERVEKMAWDLEVLRHGLVRFLSRGQRSGAEYRRIKREIRGLADRIESLTAPEVAALMWDKLYRISASLYVQENHWEEDKDMPIFSVNAHNFATRYWLREFLAGKQVPSVVHFDTHADMDHLARPDDLVAAFANLRAERQTAEAWQVLSEGVSEIAQPVSAGTLLMELEHVVWVKPPWAYRVDDLKALPLSMGRRKALPKPPPPLSHYVEKQRTDDPAADEWTIFASAVAQAFEEVLEQAETEDGFWEADVTYPLFLPVAGWDQAAMEEQLDTPWYYLFPDAPDRTASDYETGHPFKMTVATWDERRKPEALAAIVAAIPGDKYILDVDLDFFATNGEEWNQIVEPTSHGRISPAQAGALHTGGAYAGATWYELRRERQLVDQRLADFFWLLRNLRDAGKTPSLVTIADSVAVLPIHVDSDEAGTEGGPFVPPSLVFHIHERVRDGLREMFPD